MTDNLHGLIDRLHAIADESHSPALVELADMMRAAIASAPQASQPPQGAEPWCSCEPTRCEGIGRCRWHAMNYSPLAAPPQGAASPLTDDSAAGSDFEHELRSGGRWSPEMIERVAGAEPAIFNAISAYTPPGTHSATASPLPAPQEPAAEPLPNLDDLRDLIFNPCLDAGIELHKHLERVFAEIGRLRQVEARRQHGKVIGGLQHYAAPAPDSTP